MPTEHKEHVETEHALGQVYDYISSGTNEGISYSLSRLTDDLFTDSFLAGGDISLFSPGGHRGTIHSQDSTGWMLSADGGAALEFPVELSVDLSTGEVSGSWTLPDGIAQAPAFELQHVKTVSRLEGMMLLFAGETSSDDGAYSLVLLLI